MRRTVLIACLAACGGGDSPPDAPGMGVPVVDCTKPIPRFLDVLAFPRQCNDCHSIYLETPQDRRNAPPGVDYDDYTRARTHAMAAAIAVNEGTMPLTGSIYPAEREPLYLWALCGTPP